MVAALGASISWGTLRWAIAAWAGAAAGSAVGSWWPAALLAVVAVVMVGRWRGAAVLAGIAAAAMLSGWGAEMRADAVMAVPLPDGEVALEAVVLVDPLPSGEGYRMLVATRGTSPVGSGIPILVEVDAPIPAAAGDLVRIEGRIGDRPGRIGRNSHRGVMRDADVVAITAASGPFFAPGNRLRRMVRDRLGGEQATPSAALLSGFLVGDTSHLPEDRLDDLRRAGLTHFVAVSGSNVALFLAAWWLLVGPLGLDPRLRAATGLAALGIFVVMTRWEPSVVRAATMAAVVLGGRLIGLPVDPWRALGTAVTVLLLVSGDLAFDVGFQLSVAATVGVMIGVGRAPRRRPQWVFTVLWATAGAQLAVLPVLLWRFGTVPLLSPLANLVASPLVAVATSIGGVGVFTGIGPIRDLGVAGAGLVLVVARTAASWPQVGAVGAAVAVAAVAAMRRSGLRPAVVVAAVTLAASASFPAALPPVPTVTFLDVGQGDAVVVRDPGGGTALIDGGREPAVLRQALRRAGVTRLDLLVVTHGDADHAAGLAGLVSTMPVGELWLPAHQADVTLIAALVAEAGGAGVPVRPVDSGHRVALGGIGVEVIGPQRRYAADNDGSVVLWVDSGDATALLTGDVEAIAQRELPELRPDVLQVPHHGSATTDPAWLTATIGPTAVISVGENPYGHPAPEILATLEASGADIRTTLTHGDVVIALCTTTCPN